MLFVDEDGHPFVDEFGQLAQFMFDADGYPVRTIRNQLVVFRPELEDYVEVGTPHGAVDNWSAFRSKFRPKG